MLFLPEILTWFFYKILSLAGDFLFTLEPPFQFFNRFFQLLQLLSLIPSSSPAVVLLCLVLELVSYL